MNVSEIIHISKTYEGGAAAPSLIPADEPADWGRCRA